MRSLLRACALTAAWIVAGVAILWAAGALAFDLPWPGLRRPVALAFVAVVLILVWISPRRFKPVVPFTAAAIVAAWWFSLRPSHDRPWQPEVARLARAGLQGDQVTLHNVRHFDYRTPTDFTPRWESRTVNLSQLTGADIAINYWGSPWMAHPIISFQFADADPICFSIETRKEIGESYSALGGLYRQFELIYIVADERDVLRVRTSIRQGEDVYLYRMTLTPAQARQRFLQYIHALNELHERPRWYNAITTNCTTTIRAQTPAEGRLPWD